MDEKVAELLVGMGADGITAFYVYMAVETLQLFVIVPLTGWGAWKALKYLMENT